MFIISYYIYYIIDIYWLFLHKEHLMNMDMNPCMNAEIWAQLADEHMLFCCLTRSWFESAPRSIKSETHTSKLWRRFESEARGRKNASALNVIRYGTSPCCRGLSRLSCFKTHWHLKSWKGKEKIVEIVQKVRPRHLRHLARQVARQVARQLKTT